MGTTSRRSLSRSRRARSTAGTELVTRVSGLLLTAVAVQFVADAVRQFIREGV